MKSALFAVLALFFSSAVCHAGGAGTTAAEFLRQDPMARGFALGGLYLPLGNDVAAAYINPAVLGHMTGHGVGVSAWRGLDGASQYGFAGLVLDAGRVGSFGINYLRYSSGSEDIYDLEGNLTKVVLQEDYAASVGWGRNIGERLFFGLQAKSVNSRLAENYEANAITFNTGVMFKSLDDKFTLGAGVENFGGELKYLSEADPLPRALRGEIGYTFGLGRDTVMVAGGVKLTEAEGDLDGGAGIEYTPGAFPIALRAGMRREAEEMAFSAGLGLRWRSVGLDYGFQPVSRLGETAQRLSLSVNFGPDTELGRAGAYRQKGLRRKALAMGYTYTGPKVAVSVLDPETGAGVTKEQGRAIADALRAGLGRSPKLQLVAREQTEQILKEQHFQYSVCGDRNCAVEAGKLLGVKKIFSISAVRIEERFALTIKAIDVETGAQDYAYTHTADSVEKLYDLAVKFADQMALGD